MIRVSNGVITLIVCSVFDKDLVLKTLFNIAEALLKKNGWTLMSVLYDDVQMDQETARDAKWLDITI